MRAPLSTLSDRFKEFRDDLTELIAQTNRYIPLPSSIQSRLNIRHEYFGYAVQFRGLSQHQNPDDRERA